MDDIQISAPAADRIEQGWPSPINPLGVGIPLSLGIQTHVLKQGTFLHDLIISNKIVVTGNTQNFTAGINLITNNIFVQTNANSDFKALESVSVNTEFRAELGSEVHIYTSQVFPECEEFTDYKKLDNPTVSAESISKNDDAEIEIKFKMKTKTFNFYLQPNPNNGNFTLTIEQEEDNTDAELYVYNLMGRLIYQTMVNSETLNLDFSDLAKGIYSIHLKNKKKVASKKLIIQ